MAINGYPLSTETKNHLEVAVRSRRIGRILAYLLNRSGERAAQKLVAGGVAGPITVTGIATDDRLVSVLAQDDITGILTDLTAEFTISAANTVTNAGGTNTTGSHLLVSYGDRT